MFVESLARPEGAQDQVRTAPGDQPAPDASAVAAGAAPSADPAG